MKNIPFIEQYFLAGHKISDMFVHCTFATTQLSCEEYTVTTITNAGLCFTFNPQSVIDKKGNLYMDHPTAINGVQLIIDVEPDEYLVPTLYGEGVRIVVHSPDIVPYIDSNTVSVPLGQEGNLYIII